MNCIVCRFYKRYGESDKGECHRYPPATTLHERIITMFPAVKDTDWCGEYSIKETHSCFTV